SPITGQCSARRAIRDLESDRNPGPEADHFMRQAPPGQDTELQGTQLTAGSLLRQPKTLAQATVWKIPPFTPDALRGFSSLSVSFFNFNLRALPVFASCLPAFFVTLLSFLLAVWRNSRQQLPCREEKPTNHSI